LILCPQNLRFNYLRY